MIWLRRVFSRRRLERDLDRELAFHVDRLVEDLVASGVPVEDARRRAALRFGGVDVVKEAARDVRGTRWLENLARDARYAVRAMRRNRGFTVAAVLSLALGVGANAAVFGVIRALLLRPLPIAHPANVFFLNRTGFDEQNLRFSHPALVDLRRDVPQASFCAMGSTSRVQVSSGGPVELAVGQLVTGNWFDVLGVRAQAGRVLNGGDDRVLGGGPVAVLSDEYWTRRFGRDPAIVGRGVRVNSTAITVVGVAAPRFRGLEVGISVDLWLPVTMQHDLRYEGNASVSDADIRQAWLPQDGVEWLTIVARLPEGRDAFTRTAARIDHVYRQHREQCPWIAQTVDPRRRAHFLREHARLIEGGWGTSYLREEMSSALFVLMAAVGLLLLLACANMANLLLARGSARSLELAVRSSLGASRGRLVAQFLTESTLLALLGGAAGVAVGHWCSLGLLRLASSGSRPIPLDVPVDWSLLAFALAVSLAAGFLIGLIPALRLSKTPSTGDLSAARRVVGSRGTVAFGRSLVVAQVAVSLVLIVGAGLFVKTLTNLMSIDAKLDLDDVVTARFDARLAGFSPEYLPALYERLLDRARLVPGARGASLAVSGPVSGSAHTSTITVEGRTAAPESDDSIREDWVSTGHFATVGTRLLRGRTFTALDDERSAKVAVVNEAMVRQFFRGADAIGRHFGTGGKPDVEIVGIVADAKVDGPRDPAPAMAYFPLAQYPGSYVRNLYLRVSGAPAAAQAELRRAIAAAEPNLAVREVVALAELNARLVSRERLVSSLTLVFGLLAVAVACLGLYGTVSYSVVRRTNEIGIRLALGAPPRAVRLAVLRETLILTTAGLAVGLCLALPALQALRTMLFALSPRDPGTLAAGACLVAIVGFSAGIVPAWKASRIDPIAALRKE
jgi:predicted permease